MLGRIIHFLVGAVAAAGGGYLVWIHRSSTSAIFPPTAGEAPWLVILGLAAVCLGVVLLASAAAPRPRRAARRAAEEARRQEALAAADAYYAEHARAADRDWRSGNLPAAAPARADPGLTSAVPSSPAALPTLADAPSGKAAAAKPVASSAPPASLMHQPFPASATLAPIPGPADPPPLPVAAPAPVPVAASSEQPGPAAHGSLRFAAIRAAIVEGRLDAADKLLTVERETAEGEALAELTGLAGDQAAAAGRQSNAKWLWRLALKRFGDADAMASPAARAVSERLRLSDQ